MKAKVGDIVKIKRDDESFTCARWGGCYAKISGDVADDTVSGIVMFGVEEGHPLRLSTHWYDIIDPEIVELIRLSRFF